MKKIFRILFLTLTLLLTACAARAIPTPADSPLAQIGTPVAPSTGFSSSDAVVASAEVIPLNNASMAFVISAPVKEILVKEGDTVKSGQALVTLDTPALEISITEAELGLKSAELLFQRANDPYKKVFEDGRVTYVTGYLEKRKETQARLQGAQASLDEAKSALEQGTLTAPFDGMIVNLDIDPGEVTQPGKVVLIIANTAHMQIKTTDLSERDIPKVSIGESVNIFIEALNTRTSGKVARISPMSKMVGGDVVYPITIELDKQLEGLLWGMSAEVEISTK